MKKKKVFELDEKMRKYEKEVVLPVLYHDFLEKLKEKEAEVIFIKKNIFELEKKLYDAL